MMENILHITETHISGIQCTCKSYNLRNALDYTSIDYRAKLRSNTPCCRVAVAMPAQSLNSFVSLSLVYICTMCTDYYPTKPETVHATSQTCVPKYAQSPTTW